MRTDEIWRFRSGVRRASVREFRRRRTWGALLVMTGVFLVIGTAGRMDMDDLARAKARTPLVQLAAQAAGGFLLLGAGRVLCRHAGRRRSY